MIEMVNQISSVLSFTALVQFVLELWSLMESSMEI